MVIATPLDKQLDELPLKYFYYCIYFLTFFIPFSSFFFRYLIMNVPF